MHQLDDGSLWWLSLTSLWLTVVVWLQREHPHAKQVRYSSSFQISKARLERSSLILNVLTCFVVVPFSLLGKLSTITLLFPSLFLSLCLKHVFSFPLIKKKRSFHAAVFEIKFAGWLSSSAVWYTAKCCSRVLLGTGFPVLTLWQGVTVTPGSSSQPNLLLPWFLVHSLEFVEAVSPPSHHRWIYISNSWQHVLLWFGR